MLRPVLLVLLVACATETAPTTSGTPPQPPSEVVGSDRVLATWDGGQLTEAQLLEKRGAEFDQSEREYQIERWGMMNQALSGAVDDALLEAEAKKEGLENVEALLDREIRGKLAPPDDAAIEAFYNEVKDQLRGAPLEVVKDMLAGELVKRQMGEGYQAYLAELRKRTAVKTQLPYPDLKPVDVAVVDADPILGAKDAPISIVQFAEYQCYFCNKVNPTLDALVKDYDGKVNVVFKDFPLENHPRAFPASVAARCAGDQGKYWEMNKTLLGNQRNLEDSDFKAYATELELEAEPFEACLTAGTHDTDIRASFTEGQRIGVQATPTFFVNGTLVSGAQPYDVFKAVIDQALAKK